MAALPRRTRLLVLLLTAGLGCLLFLWRLGSAGLVDETPPLFAASARAMVARGDWLIPHVNGLPRYDKPPLVYWLMGLLYALPGQARWDPLGTWASSLPSALATIAVMLGLADTLLRWPQPLLQGWRRRRHPAMAAPDPLSPGAAAAQGSAAHRSAAHRSAGHGSVAAPGSAAATGSASATGSVAAAPQPGGTWDQDFPTESGSAFDPRAGVDGGGGPVAAAAPWAAGGSPVAGGPAQDAPPSGVHAALLPRAAQRRAVLTALAAPLAFALSPLVLLWGRIPVSDALFTAMVALTALAFWRRLADPCQPWSLPWLLLGLAVLTKGPVAVVLLGLSLALFLLLQADAALLPRLRPLRGLLLTGLVTLPWYGLALWRDGSAFWDSFFGYHNLQRFTAVVNDHRAPWWFFVPVLLLAALPVTPLLLLGLQRAIGPLRWRRCRGIPLPAAVQGLPAESSLARFAACWLLAILLFFTAAATKLPSYWLPATPAAALLIALVCQLPWESSSARAGGSAARERAADQRAAGVRTEGRSAGSAAAFTSSRPPEGRSASASQRWHQPQAAGDAAPGPWRSDQPPVPARGALGASGSDRAWVDGVWVDGARADAASARQALADGPTTDNSAVAGSVPDGLVATGATVTGATVTGATAAGPVAVSPVADGAMADRSAADGVVVAGSVADVPLAEGAVAQGSVVDGRVGDGAMADGVVLDGSVEHGSAVDVPVAEGPLADGPVADGPVVDGALMDRVVADGAVADGVVAGPGPRLAGVSAAASRPDRAFRLAWGLSVALAALLALAFALAPLWVPLIFDPEMPTLPAELLASGFLVRAAWLWALAALLGWLLRARPAPQRLLALQLPLVLFVPAALLPSWALGDRLRGLPVRQIAAAASRLAGPREPLAMVGILKPSLHYYSGRVVIYEGIEPEGLVNLADRLRHERRPGQHPAPPAQQPSVLVVIDRTTAASPFWQGLQPRELSRSGLYRLWRLDRRRLERRAADLQAAGHRLTWTLPRPERY